MREYDSNLPLIVIHIPKTAGVTCREIFKGWFGDRMLFHYFKEATGEMPHKYDLAGMHSRENPILLYGHFNRLRNFGIEHYYPEAEQFITILRDPFERAISGYFYMRKNQSNWKYKSRIPRGELRDHLFNLKWTMLNHFPREVTMDNYKEMIETRFIEIGITECLDESLRRIAKKLNQPYNSELLGQLNVTERDQRIPYELREEFIEKRPLDYAVYNYVYSRYK